MSTEERLVYMANQIARNLVAKGHDAAVLAVADHIAAFWAPRMRASILANDGAALDPVAARAVHLLRTRDTSARHTVSNAIPDGSDAG